MSKSAVTPTYGYGPKWVSLPGAETRTLRDVHLLRSILLETRQLSLRTAFAECMPLLPERTMRASKDHSGTSAHETAGRRRRHKWREPRLPDRVHSKLDLPRLSRKNRGDGANPNS